MSRPPTKLPDITAAMITEARERGLNQSGYAKERGMTLEQLRYAMLRLKLKWNPPSEPIVRVPRSKNTCGRGHPKAKYWQTYGGRQQCIACGRIRALKWREAVAAKVSGPVQSWTWLDWMAAATKEANENHPHWVPRKSDAIKAWLVANKVSP